MAKVYDLVMSVAERKYIAAWRREALAQVRGKVLEIGAGTGANLPYYPPSLEKLVLLEPDPGMRSRLQDKLAKADLSGEVGTASAEELPFADESFDWVVSTLVLCSVENPSKALAELHRVLRPGGKLAFVEHILDPEDVRNRRRQRRYQPLWGLVAAHCQVTRDTEASIRQGGFEIASLEHSRLGLGPKIVRPMIRGSASRA